MDFVCEPFVVQFIRQHQALNSELRRLEAMVCTFIDAPDAAHRDQLAAEIGEYQKALESLFLQEDEGGCLEEVVCRCPAMSAQVNSLERERPRLLARLNELADLVNSSADVGEVVKAIDDFAQRVRRHEEGLNQVVQLGLNTGLEVSEILANE